MDLEMTGLEPAKHVIVEIATLITDDELEIVAEGPDLVVHQPEEALALMEPVVVEMHTKSGLLDAIRTSTVTLEEAGAATLDFIKSHCARNRAASRCAATRSAWTGASSTTTCPTSRTGCTTAAST
jgi:oligoribonuclease